MKYVRQLLYFSYQQALSCIFPVAIFITLALSKIIHIPGLYRYDFILLVCLLIQYAMYKTGMETKDELKVIAVFHLIGLLLEIYKVYFGSWAYPEQAWTKIFGVPLYSGFMYASVASYICQAWRRLHLQMHSWPNAMWTIQKVGFSIEILFYFIDSLLPAIFISITRSILLRCPCRIASRKTEHMYQLCKGNGRK